MSQDQAINFDEELGSGVVPFTYKGEKYELREATGLAAKRYTNEKSSRLTFGPNGKFQSARDLGDLEPLLVALCCFDSNDQQVPLNVVDGWPSRMVNRLFKEAKRISDIDVDDDAKSQLFKALERSDAPVSTTSLRSWVKSLPKAEYRTLQVLMEPTAEEKAKNEQSSTTDGLG